MRYELEEAAIIDEFLALAHSDSIEHSFIHTIPPYHSSKGYTVLHLHYIENPTANVNEIAYDETKKKKKIPSSAVVCYSTIHKLFAI